MLETYGVEPKQLIEVKPDSTTQTHNLDVTKTPKPGIQTPTVSPDNNPGPSNKIKAGLENIGKNIKDFFGKFNTDTQTEPTEENKYYELEASPNQQFLVP